MSRYSKLFLALAIGFAGTGGCSSRGDDVSLKEAVGAAELQLQGAGIAADITVWPGGDTFSAQILVRNSGATATSNWEVDVQLHNGVLRNTPSNATGSLNGTVLTLRSASYNGVLSPGATANVGIDGIWNSTPHTNATILAVRRDVGSTGSGGASTGGSSTKGGAGGTLNGSGGTGGSAIGGFSTGGGSNSAGSAGSAGVGSAASTSGGSGGSGGSSNNNVALNRPSSASSALTGNPASLANDASSTTSWCASTSAPNESWTVDLGDNYALTGTEISWPYSGGVYQYAIGISNDGASFSEIVDQRNNTRTSQTQTDSFFAEGRYLRFTVTGLPTSPVTSACLSDFKAFGTLVATSGGGGAGGVGTGMGGTQASSTSGGSGASPALGGAANAGGAFASGSTGSNGSTTGGVATGGATNTPGTNVDFFFQLPKGVHRSEVAMATFGGDLYVDDNVNLKSKSGFAAVSSVAGGKVARLGISAQTGNVWSDGTATLANYAVVNGDIVTGSTAIINAGAKVVGETHEHKNIGPLQTVKPTFRTSRTRYLSDYGRRDRLRAGRAFESRRNGGAGQSGFGEWGDAKCVTGAGDTGLDCMVAVVRGIARMRCSDCRARVIRAVRRTVTA